MENIEKVEETSNEDGVLLSADQLVACSEVEHKIFIEELNGHIVVRPITLKVVQRASNAGKGDEVEVSRCIIRQAVVRPELNDTYIDKMPIGLVNKISKKINEISGISKDMLNQVKKN